jgi:hypothetical protein
MDEIGGACVMGGEKRNAYRLLIGKPDRVVGEWIIAR